MSYELDEGRGRSTGSVIRMQGRVAGLRLGLEEVVTERQPPVHKVWETRGAPRLLVVGSYRMGFDIEAQDKASRLRLFIDFFPGNLRPASLNTCLARTYGRWCIKQMGEDACRHFGGDSAP